MENIPLLDYPLPAGTVMQWLTAIGLTVVIVLAARLAKPILVRRLEALSKRTRLSIDDALVHALDSTRLWLVAIIAASVGSQPLDLPSRAQQIVDGAAAVALFLQIGLWLADLLKFWLDRSEQKARAASPGAATSLAAVGFVGRIVLWSVIALLALDNLGINVTTLIAGLGIGGIAVALAVQNVLGDLFASLSIVIDKPFVVGDFIIVDDYMGTVEHVGLKTTRIRSLGGEQIIFSNSDLLKSRTRNYKRMYERRIVFKFGVTYQAKPQQLEQIPPLVKRLVEKHQDKVRFERAHFFAFGESSLDFEVVFWVRSPDYNLYMDIQQAVNLALMRELDAMGVQFAYPTRTLFVEGPVQLEGAARGNGEHRGEPGESSESGERERQPRRRPPPPAVNPS
jgi:small-conductance mechanosensitive channel